MTEGLFPLGLRVESINSTPFCRVEPHDVGDLECPDRFWLKYTPDDELSEGEYITIGQESQDAKVWSADHDLAHRYGGTPTVWSAWGTEQEVFEAVALYLSTLNRSPN